MHRSQFPIFKNNPDLIYFDNAATTHKPISVINAISDFYAKHNSNVNRSYHSQSKKAENLVYNTRIKVKEFINAKSENEIVFTTGTTGSINLLASSIKHKLNLIFLTFMEHSSNIIPFLINNNFYADFIPLKKDYQIDLESLKFILEIKNIDYISITHVSNVTGVINNIKEIVKIAHKYNVKVIVDGAQAISHLDIDVQDLDCDFYCFSGHKMYAPMGIGVMYAKEKYLKGLNTYQGGGGMNTDVSFERYIPEETPYKFEAGTQNIASIIGLGEAIDFINNVGKENIRKQEKELLEYLTMSLNSIDNVTIYGDTENKAPIVSFNVKGINPIELSLLLDEKNIAIRAGTLCAKPFVTSINKDGVARASLTFYNTKEEIDIFIETLKRIIIDYNR